MKDILELFLSKVDQDITRIIFIIVCCVFIYLSILVIMYVSFLFLILWKNNQAAKKRDIVLFHKFNYSWFKGVNLSPIVVEKGEIPLEKKKPHSDVS